MINWIEVKISTTTDAIDSVSGILLSIGISGFVIEDANDFNEFLTSTEYRWDYIDEELMQRQNSPTSITVYLPENEQGKQWLFEIKDRLETAKISSPEIDFGTLEIELKNIREEDWANNWKQYFKPLKIGNKLLIKPSWEDYKADGDERIILEIDPASSFGTGQHHTTRLCLELLEKSIEKGDELLDMGCGSGILSIGAMLLGAENAVAVDIEENAVASAIENAAKNNIPEDKYIAYCGNVLSDNALADKIDKKYDIITANIVADVLIAMGSLFDRYLKENGILIISGIIEERMDEVINAVENCGFTKLEQNIKEGWAAVKLIHK